MITCEVIRRHVDAVVDGELDPDTQIEFEQHLATCGPCRVHLSFASAFKRSVKASCETTVAPEGLAARIAAALDAEDAQRAAAEPGAPVGAAGEVGPPLGISGIRRLPVRARYAVPAAAAVVALAVIAAHETGGQRLEAETLAMPPGASIFEDVMRRHQSAHPSEVSGEPTQIASWFRDKLDFPVRPVDFANPDVHLVGARISNINDREAAAFFYRVHGHRVTVMVFEPPAELGRGAHRTRVQGRGMWYGRVRGFTVPVVEHDGLSYAFASDLDSRSVLRLAASARLMER